MIFKKLRCNEKIAINYYKSQTELAVKLDKQIVQDFAYLLFIKTKIVN